MSLTSLWASAEFGDAYHERNRNVQRVAKVREAVIETQAPLAVFGSLLAADLILAPLARDFLEIGCGAGHNTSTVADLCRVVGVDVNVAALREMRERTPGALAVVAEAQRLPFLDHSFDFSCTVGCLIHVPTAHLRSAYGEIYRVTRPGGYVLIAEYEAEQETVVPYRGQEAALFKRPYAEFGEWRPDLSLVWERHWGKADGWDDVTSRLWRKEGKAVHSK